MLDTIRNTLKDFWLFLKVPKDQQDVIQSNAQKFKRLWTLLAVDIPLIGLLAIVIGAFSKLGWLKLENHQINLLLERLPIGMVLLLAIIVIPFLEEVAFRLMLRLKSNYFLQAIISVFPGKDDKTKNAITSFWNKRYAYIFYLFAILFALIHITNYDAATTSIYLLPIIILPQFIVALFTGYLRVRYSFIMGYLMHVLHNAFFITIAILSISAPISKLELDNDMYTLNITEVTIAKTTSLMNAKDSIHIDGASIKSAIAFLSKTDESLIDADQLPNKKISLNFKGKTKSDLNNDSIVLAQLSNIYSFKIVPKNRIKKVYTLYLQDSVRLSKHYVLENSLTNQVTISPKSITLKNATLEQITKTLSEGYKLRFKNDIQLPQQFNMTVPNGKVTALKKVLEKEYGIAIKVTEQNTEYLFINVLK